MEIDSNVWVKCSPDGAWFRARVLKIEQLSSKSKHGEAQWTFDLRMQDNSGSLTSKLETVTTVAVNGSMSEFEVVKLRNLCDDSSIDLIEDLITLHHLHEPSILRCLQARFSNQLIYTNTGPILIAVNPFCNISMYSRERVLQYRDCPMELSQTLPPHVFKIADNAYRNMLINFENGDFSRMNQSILVSGESGEFF